MSSVAAIRVEGLAKVFGAPGPASVTALRDVSFTVGAGAALAVVGENGSGKSTLLDLLLGLTRPSAGRAEVAGPSASLLELGAGFFLELTGRQNAAQAALLAGLSRTAAADLVARAQEFAELGPFFDLPTRTYSAGMLMRLGFAVASSLPAPVVVVDEVLAVGDGYFQRKCVERLLELRRQRSTLVIAAHDLHALRGLCDLGLWLDRGGVAAFGPAQEVIDGYEQHLRRKGGPGGPLPGRSGTGEVAVLGVRLTDGQGRERDEFEAGATLRVEVEFETRQPLESPVMGVALFRDDGVCVHGPNTLFDGSCRGRYDGRYLLRAEFEQLPLLGGDYQASVAFYDRDHVYAYAWHHRLYPFKVLSARADHGVVELRHRFEVRPLEARA